MGQLENNPKNCTTLSDSLPKQCVFNGSALLAFITQTVNISKKFGTFPVQLKHALVKPLLQKLSLDNNVLKNYSPVQ